MCIGDRDEPRLLQRIQHRLVCAQTEPDQRAEVRSAYHLRCAGVPKVVHPANLILSAELRLHSVL